MAVGVMQRLEDLNTVLGQTNDHRHRVLAAAAKNIKVNINFHFSILNQRERGQWAVYYTSPQGFK